jgi:hypothetical protein
MKSYSTAAQPSSVVYVLRLARRCPGIVTHIIGSRWFCTAMPSPSNIAMGVRASASKLRRGKSSGINVGEQPYEEITVFFLDHPDAVPQPNEE